MNPKDLVNWKEILCSSYVTAVRAHLISSIFNTLNHIYSNQKDSFCKWHDFLNLSSKDNEQSVCIA